MMSWKLVTDSTVMNEGENAPLGRTAGMRTSSHLGGIVNHQKQSLLLVVQPSQAFLASSRSAVALCGAATASGTTSW
jgi:hypothetical protein